MIREVLIHLFTITTKRAKKTWPKRKYIEILQINYIYIWGARTARTVAAFKKTLILTSRTKGERFSAVSENAAHKDLFAELQNTLCVQKLELLAVHKTFQIPVCTRLLPHSYFTSYIVNDVSGRPIALCGRQCKSARNSGKRFLGNAKWR